jgi:hypothetical protein
MRGRFGGANKMLAHERKKHAQNNVHAGRKTIMQTEEDVRLGVRS